MVRRGTVDGLAPPPGYSHFAVAPPARLVFTAGQVPLDEDGALVGRGDPAAQARRVLENLLATLRAAGARPDDVVKSTVYVVGDRAARLDVWEVVRSSPVGSAPSTLLGVAALGYTDQLVEIEAIAAIPA